MLTTGADMIVGTAADDTINALLGDGATLTVLDSIDAGAGKDTCCSLHQNYMDVDVSNYVVLEFSNSQALRGTQNQHKVDWVMMGGALR